MSPLTIQTDRSASPSPVNVGDLRGRLRGFVAKCSFVRQASVFDEEGGCQASAGGGEPEAAALQETVAKYPRRGLKRLLVRTDEGLILVATLAGGGCLLVLTDNEVRTGTVCMKVDRLIRDMHPPSPG